MKRPILFFRAAVLAALIISACFILSACAVKTKLAQKNSPEYYTSHVIFPEGASLDEKLDMASRLIPSQKQLHWQDLELTAFIHFGMNTFTDREWGDGTESPSWYNPTDLDTEQWVKELQGAGFKMVILTAKHHDGFCLWDTKTTRHSVRYSPAWKGGEGDVMEQLRTSCDKYDMKLGVYLSPWDRNARSYGTGQEYNELFLAQLRELLTNYGTIDEVWFDGANGEGANGKVQEYDWEPVFELIRELQPGAVTAIMGRDVRWVGNEKGLGRETEWSATPLPSQSLAKADSIFKALGIKPTSKDLGSRELVAKSGELFWYPSEVDVSIRPGWFYHKKERPKTVQALADIYLKSVGRNSVLLLNVPPDPRGKISDEDVKVLRAFGKFVRDLYASDVAGNRDIDETNSLISEDGKEYGITEDGYPCLTIKVPAERSFDILALSEDISKGQKIETFRVETGRDKKNWTIIASGTTIGHKRLIHLEKPVTQTFLRLVITGHRGKVGHLNYTLKAYRMPSLPDAVETADSETETILKHAKQPDSFDLMNNGRIKIALAQRMSGFVFFPSEDGNTVTHYKLFDRDGRLLQKGSFDNIINNPIPQIKELKQEEKSGILYFEFLDINDHAAPISASQLLFYE